jgi:hypothetical protein
MSSQAIYKEAQQAMRVRFESGGSSGTGNSYQYNGIDADTRAAFMAGRLGGGSGTATYAFLTALGGTRI